MSSYRRFISYMYDCRQGQKRKNCGFLKIEVKNNRCIIIFQLKNAPCTDKCNVYLCFRGSDPEYLFLQSIPIQKGSTQCKIETSSLHMAGGNGSFSQCCGILCTDEKGNHCCTCWDAAGELPAYEPRKESKLIAETEPVAEAEDESVPTAEDESSTASKSETIAEEGSDSAASTSGVSTQKPRTFPELWKHMQQEFPALNPFEDNAIVESIRIAPSDLGYLQACNLDLGSNQFLLHGYKCYHHLLMGRLHGQMQYLIGVPGIYDPQEQFMAKMFGFPCFKPIRECRQKNGLFGYWLHCFR